MASRISDHDDLIFLSNSDAHSLRPHRLGREFNRAELSEESFEGLKKLFAGEEGEMKLNLGLDPREGKYHCSACNSCHQKYSMEEAEEFKWSCQECSGTIKKGVIDRVNELSNREAGYEVDYLHLPPLAKIIQMTVDHASPTTKTVQKKWKAFNEKFGDEASILIDEEISELAKVDEEIAESIRMFREDEIIMIPGGGGEYGKRILPENKEEASEIMENRELEINCCYHDQS